MLNNSTIPSMLIPNMEKNYEYEDNIDKDGHEWRQNKYRLGGIGEYDRRYAYNEGAFEDASQPVVGVLHANASRKAHLAAQKL